MAGCFGGTTVFFFEKMTLKYNKRPLLCVAHTRTHTHTLAYTRVLKGTIPNINSERHTDRTNNTPSERKKTSLNSFANQNEQEKHIVAKQDTICITRFEATLLNEEQQRHRQRFLDRANKNQDQHITKSPKCVHTFACGKACDSRTSFESQTNEANIHSKCTYQTMILGARELVRVHDLMALHHTRIKWQFICILTQRRSNFAGWARGANKPKHDAKPTQ